MALPLLTISQLASYAGVTMRAVRHYHDKGLLPEPERDVSGYRRYDARDVVDVIRIRTLADSGVPLARIKELIVAPPEQFAEALAEIDSQLRERVHELEAHRHRVALLSSAERLALPPEANDYLDKLRAAGASQRGLAMERDQWILIAARYPDQMKEWMEYKSASLDNPGYVRVLRVFDQAFDWDPDDPRLEDLADDFAAFVEREYASYDGPEDAGLTDETLVDLLDEHVLTASPAWARLSELLEKRGWVGWSNIRPAAD